MKEKLVHYNGLKLKEIRDPGLENLPIIYYMIDPFSKLALESGIYDIHQYNVPCQDEKYQAIDELEGPIAIHPADLPVLLDLDDSIDFTDYNEKNKEDQQRADLHFSLSNLIYRDFIFEQDGKKGLMNVWGEVILPAEYEDCYGAFNFRILSYKRQCIAVRKNGKWGFVTRNRTHEQIVDYRFEEVLLYFEGIFIVKENGLYGIYSRNGVSYLEPIADDIFRNAHQVGFPYIKNGRYGFAHGPIEVPPIIEEMDNDSVGTLPVKVDGRWGYISKEGRFTVKRSEAAMESCFELTSIPFWEPTNYDPENNDEEYITAEELDARLKRLAHRKGMPFPVSGSSLEHLGKIEIGLVNTRLYFTKEDTKEIFCINMDKIYRMQLLDDRFHDLQTSWEGHRGIKDAIKRWLNEPNSRTGNPNWVELIYYCNSMPYNKDRSIRVTIAPRKRFDLRTVSIDEIDNTVFPLIAFEQE